MVGAVGNARTCGASVCTLRRYRIEAVGRVGSRATSTAASRKLFVRVPYSDDAQKNFAYFVYDESDIPAYVAAINPKSASYSMARLEAFMMRSASISIPNLFILVNSTDFSDALYTSPASSTGPMGGYRSMQFPWRCTVVYEGRVHDHVGLRARGGLWRYALGKNMIKLRFNSGHLFEAEAFKRIGRKAVNLNSVIQQGDYRHRGDHGMFHAVTMRMFEMVGVESPFEYWLQLRVVRAEAETGKDQYTGDFYGLYLNTEEPDKRWQEAHGLPRGNLFKMDSFTGFQKVQGEGQSESYQDLDEFILSYGESAVVGPTAADAKWWRANLDLSRSVYPIVCGPVSPR